MAGFLHQLCLGANPTNSPNYRYMVNQETISPTHLQYLEGGGEMGALIRSFDWSKTPIGSPESWPESLLLTVSTILNSKFPMFLWWGPELIQFYNDAYRPSLGNEGKHPTALGQRGEECWPEIWPIIKPLIDQVLSGGGATWSEDQLIPIYRNGKLEDVYWTFSYSAIKDEHSARRGVLVICNETTEKVEALNELKKAQFELQQAKSETEWQRDRLKRFFMQAPAGICILDGPDLVFELINPPYQRLFPGRELLGRSVYAAVPEINDQPIAAILRDVYQNGTHFEGKEVYLPVYSLERDTYEDRYFNFIYQPRLDTNGEVDGILVFVFEVTEMVNVRKDLEAAKDSLKLALEAAELGTFDMDVGNNHIFWDARCRALFGVNHDDNINFERDFLDRLHPEDRDLGLSAFQNAFMPEFKGEYDVEYRVIYDNLQTRWLRAKGKMYFDDQGKPNRFIGSVLDITEQKTDEIRKNDFIAMVSHELKTPLTSLTAYTQLLQTHASRTGDSFTADALLKVNNQVKKMSTLINGFLNVSRLESSKISLSLERFNLDALVAVIIDESKLISSSHQIIFHPCDPIPVVADREKIGSVVSNLLGNAIKYSSKGKTIEISCERISGKARVSVKDEGIGINAKELDKLFDRYYRVESKNYQHISGFGIGLYLSAEIINIHAGRIWVDSEPGKGSTFYFEIPLASGEQ